jgi:hypothetical protein
MAFCMFQDALQVDLDAFQDSAGEVLDRLLWGSSGYLHTKTKIWM